MEKNLGFRGKVDSGNVKSGFHCIIKNINKTFNVNSICILQSRGDVFGALGKY